MSIFWICFCDILNSLECRWHSKCVGLSINCFFNIWMTMCFSHSSSSTFSALLFDWGVEELLLFGTNSLFSSRFLFVLMLSLFSKTFYFHFMFPPIISTFSCAAIISSPLQDDRMVQQVSSFKIWDTFFIYF